MAEMALTQDMTLIWFLIFSIWVITRYFLKKEERCEARDDFYKKQIDELLAINSRHAENVRILNDKIKNDELCTEYWKWWAKNHIPTIEICSTCKDYTSCPHLKKPILK